MSPPPAFAFYSCNPAFNKSIYVHLQVRLVFLNLHQKMSVLNLFDLSRTFQTPAPSWLMNRYIEQQKPKSPHGLSPITTEATMTGPPINTPYNTPYLTSTSDVGIHQDENLVQNIPNMSQSMQANAGSSPREQEA